MRLFVKKIFIKMCLFAYKNGNRFLGGMGLQSIWPFGQIYRYIYLKLHDHNWPESWSVDGHTVYISPGQRISFAVHKGEAMYEKKFFNKEISLGDTVLDVGANIGYIMLPMARIVGKNGAVFAFEPDPMNVQLLLKNKAANGYKNITIISAAVGDRDGKTQLFLSDSNSAGNMIYDTRARVRELTRERERETTASAQDYLNRVKDADLRGDFLRSIEVDLVSLDSFFKHYEKPINFVKIDVEGSEGGVIAGMQNILKDNRSIKLMFEFAPIMMKIFGTDPREFLHNLVTAGFYFYDVADFEKIKEPRKISIDEIYRRYPKSVCNIFAKRDL